MDRIGSLREDSEGNFFVAEYVDPNWTAYPEERAAAYQKLDLRDRGPYPTISDFYAAISRLNRKYALEDPDDEDKDETIAEYEVLAEMTSKMVIDEFENGPFVPLHNDLTTQNILVSFLLHTLV
jgi:hypothetical protein